MGTRESRTVSIATCHSPSEAMMIQAMLNARGIDSIIPGAGAAAMTAAAVGFSSHVLVDAEVAEEAAALIAEMRSEHGAASSGDLDEDDPDEGAPDEGAPGDGEPDLGMVLARRHRVGVTVCLSLMLTFGAGHLFHRAYGRGILLAGLEVLGVRYLLAGHRFGTFLVIAAVVLDLLGGTALARRFRPTSPRRPLPRAKLLPPSK